MYTRKIHHFRSYRYIYICTHMCTNTHTHIHIYIYVYRGGRGRTTTRGPSILNVDGSSCGPFLLPVFLKNAYPTYFEEPSRDAVRPMLEGSHHVQAVEKDAA